MKRPESEVLEDDKGLRWLKVVEKGIISGKANVGERLISSSPLGPLPLGRLLCGSIIPRGVAEHSGCLC